MDEKNLFGRSISFNGIDLGKEGQSTGAVSGRIAKLLSMLNEGQTVSGAPLSVDPGDFIRIGDDGMPGLALALPIAYDVWYLWQTVNILPEADEDRELFVKNVLSDLFRRLGGVSPLRTVSKDGLAALGSGFFEWERIPDLSFFQGNGFYHIKEMRFETFLKDRSPEFHSNGPPRITQPGLHMNGLGAGDIYAGYVAFPVGSMGVMEDVAFVCGSILDTFYPPGTSFDGSYDAVHGETLLTPFEARNVNLKGLMLCEKGYLSACLDAEYPAEEMAGEEPIRPHHWMRLWLRKEDVWPMPGEFCGLVVKPLSVPPHCWWFQETSPFFYSGNWFETDYYTSGTILAILEPVSEGIYEVVAVSGLTEQRTGYGDRTLSDGDQFEIEGTGNIYKVRVKDQDLYLKSTDFKKYFVDDTVAIIKRRGIDNHNFRWTMLEPGKLLPGNNLDEKIDFDNKTAGQPFMVNRGWVIGPITFYQ